MPILPDHLLGLVRKCWRRDPEKRPSASDCLDVLDLVIQENLELVGVRSFFTESVVQDGKTDVILFSKVRGHDTGLGGGIGSFPVLWKDSR